MKHVLDVRDGTHDSPKYFKTGIPFVTSKNLKEGKIDFSSCKLISKEDSDKFNERSRVDDKDILFAMIGTIGNPTIVKKDRDFSIKNVALFKNINRNLLSEVWVKYVLESLTESMRNKASGGLQPFVSLDFLRNFIMPVPPLKEQLRIIELLEKIDYLIETISKEQQSLNMVIDYAKSKILNTFFGENSSYKSYYTNKFKLGDILEYEQPGPYIVSSTEYDEKFDTPVLTPGKSFILGYTNEKNGIYHPKNDKVIIFDDFTKASRLIDFDFKVKSSAMKILHTVNNSKFIIEYLYYLLQTIDILSDTHKRFWISEYAPMMVSIHTYEEQIKIVNLINDSFNILDSITK